MTPNHRLMIQSWQLSTVLGSGALTCLSPWLFWIPLPTSLKVGETNVFPCKPASRLQWDRAIDWRSQCSVNRGFCSFGRGSFVLQLYTRPAWILWSELGQAFLPMLYLVERKKHTGIQGRDEWDRISQNDTIYNIQFKKGLSIFLRSWRKTSRLLTVPIPSRPLK